MLIVIGAFLVGLAFGFPQDFIDPRAVFFFGLFLLALGLGEAANHQEVEKYEKGRIALVNPLTGKEKGGIDNMRVKKGTHYVRRPVFIGVVLDALSLIFLSLSIFVFVKTF